MAVAALGQTSIPVSISDICFWLSKNVMCVGIFFIERSFAKFVKLSFRFELRPTRKIAANAAALCENHTNTE